MPSARYRLTDRQGRTFEWGRGELADTLFESEAWESPATRKKVLALKPGQSLRRKGEKLQRLGGSRAKNPRPSIAALGTCSEHGRVHELVIAKGDEHEVHTWRGRHPLLLWSPSQRALVFVDGVKLPRPRKGAPPRDDGGAATFERFHGRAADGWRDGVPIPAVSLRKLGPAVSIAYRGERWGGKVAEHHFGRTVVAYSGARRGESVYVIAGGRLRMTARGIEG